MTTFVGLQMDLHSLLKSLIELDYDAIEAYGAALPRLTSDAYRAPLREFRDDHERHTEELSRVLRDGGRTPPKGPDLKRLLTEGKVRLAGLVSDRAILYALKSIERDSNVAYERAAKSEHVPAQLRELLRAALADARRHRLCLRSRSRVETPLRPREGPHLSVAAHACTRSITAETRIVDRSPERGQRHHLGATTISIRRNLLLVA